MTNLNNTFEILHISKSFYNKLILQDVSMQLAQGEVVGLFGPNGAGKTTCFNIIIGSVKPDTGKLVLHNQDITHLPIYLRGKMGIGYLPQESSIFRGLSVSDNIRAILEISNTDKDIIEQKIDDLLAEFSITHLKYAPSIRLSGGERRRLEIARALASNPKFLMLDEPLAGIDPIVIMDIKNLVTHLKKRNIGILITDHNVRDTLDIVDRAYIICDGKVLIEGSPQEIINNNKAREMYLGHSYPMDIL